MRPTWFTPTFDKWAGELCGGLQLHVTDAEQFSSYRFTLELLRTIIKLYPEEFSWLEPPYEYEYEKLPIDILTGDPEIRRVLEKNGDLDYLLNSWENDLQSFNELKNRLTIYD